MPASPRPVTRPRPSPSARRGAAGRSSAPTTASRPTARAVRTWFDGFAKPDILAPGTGLRLDSVEGSALAAAYPSLVYQSTGGKLLKPERLEHGDRRGHRPRRRDDRGARLQRERAIRALSMKQKKAYVTPPALTPNAIKAMLQFSATPLRDAAGVDYDALTQGAGEVNGSARSTSPTGEHGGGAGTAGCRQPPPSDTFGGRHRSLGTEHRVGHGSSVTGAGLMTSISRRGPSR